MASANVSGVTSQGRSTPEYITLQKSYTVLISYVKEHPGDVASRLFQDGYITQTTLSYIRTDGIPSDTKSQRLVDALLNDVQLNSEVFHGFLAILKAEGIVAKDITKHLEQGYATNMAKHVSPRSVPVTQSAVPHSIPVTESNESHSVPARKNSIHRNVKAIQATDDDISATGVTVIKDQCYGQPGRVEKGSRDDRHKSGHGSKESSPDHTNSSSQGGPLHTTSNGHHKRTKTGQNSNVSNSDRSLHSHEGPMYTPQYSDGFRYEPTESAHSSQNSQDYPSESVFSTPVGGRKPDYPRQLSIGSKTSPLSSITSQATNSLEYSTPTGQPRSNLSRHSSRVSATSSGSVASSLAIQVTRKESQASMQPHQLSRNSSVVSGLVMSPSVDSFCAVDGYQSDDSFHSVSDGIEPGDSMPKPQKDTYTKVELSIHCKNLKDMDLLSKSDPVVFVYESSSSREPIEWKKIGRTEVIRNNLNPKFATTFVLDYCFEEIQYLKFAVYDIDDHKQCNVEDLSRHDFIGEAQCTLGDVVAAGQQFYRELRVKSCPKVSRGQINLTAEEVQDSKYTIKFGVSGQKLDRKDLLGKSDPYLEIAKSQESGGYILVYRSEVIRRTLNPRWPEFELSIQKLCNGDWGRGLKFSVWDWNKCGNPQLIGCCYASLREICKRNQHSPKTTQCMELVNEKIKKKKKKYTSSGTLTLDMVKAIPTHTFTDYIRGGCQINLIVAIDFTESNGRPGNPSSLHYNEGDQTGDNEYVQAIKSVGSVLGPYDSDQLIPAFGFGAKVPPRGHTVSHCFPLNLSHDPEVHGVKGLLEAYHKALRRVEFSGPTNFSKFLDKARQYARLANTTQDKQNYTILLVITDGVICDMPQTVDRIVEASLLPLSIVIVGVGEADFTNMEVLDADDTPLKSQMGVPMKRDIVQFVPLRKFKSESGANFSLSREVLAEIPTQLTSFMKSRKIRPNPVRQARSASQPVIQTSRDHPKKGRSVSPSPSDPRPPLKSYLSTTSLQYSSSTRSGQHQHLRPRTSETNFPRQH